MDYKDNIIEGLKVELASAKEREKENAEARTAMLYMLEDLNTTTALVSRGEKQWEATFDAIAAPLFIHDAEMRIVRANKAYMKCAGRPFKDFIGKPYYTVFPVIDGPHELCNKFVESNGAYPVANVELIIVPDTGTTYKVIFYPVYDNTGVFINDVHILEDITDIRRADERLKQEMTVTSSLLSIAEAAAHIKDFDKLMEHIVGSVTAALRTDVCLTYLCDKSSGHCTPAKHFGLKHSEVPVFMTEYLDVGLPIIKSAIERKDVIISHNTSAAAVSSVASEIPIPSADRAEQSAVIPLIGRGGLLGVIIALWSKKTEVTEVSMKIMRGIQHQVSTAVEEARLLKESLDRSVELSNKIEMIKIMHEMDKSMLSALASEDIIDTVVRLVAKLIPCDRVAVGTFDKERSGYVVQAGFGTECLSKGAFIPIKDSSMVTVFTTGEPEFMANLSDEAALLPVEQKLLEEGFLSHVRVPIAVKGEVTTSLTVGSKRAGVFTKETLVILENLASQVGVALENARLVTDLQQLFISTVKTLTNTVEAKSAWTKGHSERMAAIAVKLAVKLGLSEDEVKAVEIASILHDIGKIATYESILNKPGKLTEDDIALIRKHPARGAEIIEPIKQLKDIIPYVRHHHEAYDGGGYPDGLKRGEIPFVSRIIAVADSVDAMSSDRPYRKGKTMTDITTELKRCSGTQFDPVVVDAFNAIEWDSLIEHNRINP